MALTLWAQSLHADSKDPATTLVRPPFKHNLGFNTLRQFHASAYGGDDLVIDDPRGMAVVKLQFKDKEGTQDDDEVTIFGVNAGRGEVIYNTSLVRLAVFGDADIPGVGLRDPVGVAAEVGGMVVVGDRGSDRVVVLQVGEQTRLRYEKSITLGDSGRALRGPAGVAIAQARVYVADSGNDRVVAVDTTGATGKLLREFRGFASPFDVDVIDGPVANYRGASFMVVTDRDGQRLSRIDLTDEGRTTLNYAEATGDDGGFGYVAIDYHGNVFVTDPVTGCMHKFTHDLVPLARWECGGAASDDLDQPRGIAIHRRLGQVFVAERSGVSYYWIGTDVTGLHARASAPAGRVDQPLDVEVRFLLTERSDVTIEVTRESGEHVVTLARKVRMMPGRKKLKYKIDPPDLPCGVAECTYRVNVRARATYASRDHLEACRSAILRTPAR